MSVRTRVAPSPTGVPHVGTAYIALFNLCLARKHGGQFVLRMEDTDQARCDDYYERAIVSGLRWLGLDWDIGPDIPDGDCSYRQSERNSIYQTHVQQLLEGGHAFYCFATPQELEQMRAEQVARGETPHYDGRDLLLSASEVEQRIKAGTPHVVRMKVPESGECVFSDELRGAITIPWQQVDMQVLLKTDGSPTYHLANVVDDHLMGITHVIRGEEWINSTPKHVLLYEYFGWKPPVWCHLPLLRNPDGSKLSKRRHPTGVPYYRRAGYLPEALCNYLGRMGWSMPDGAERFSLAEMIEDFDLKRVSLGAPVFDVDKLNWLNGEWIRSLSVSQFAQRVRDWRSDTTQFEEFLRLAQTRVETMGELMPLGGFLLQGELGLKSADFSGLKLSEAQIRTVLQLCVWCCEDLRTRWEKERIFSAFQSLAQAFELRMKDFMAPVFVAISGSTHSISVNEAMVLLGADMSIHRLQNALAVLGSLSKKELSTVQKRYAQIARS